MPRKKDVTGACMDAALSLAAIGGWNNVTLYDIATEAGIEVGEAAKAIGGRNGALRHLTTRADEAMLAAVDEDWGEESVRDRLFALLMARFDFLKTRREGLRAVLAGLPGDPAVAVMTAAGPGLKSMRLALEAAGVTSAGLQGRLRARALGLAYASVMRTFLDDDSDDLSRTMAALDRQLGRLQNMAERFRFGRRRLRGEAGNGGEPESDTLEG
ncbi:MAG: hypothetical protein ACMVY4_11440 [Minwuia sp.]|uniref:hypothetical protein n=1 Tax=Minwuia sp. TaxID=2493630 RepID=UPI003A899416